MRTIFNNVLLLDVPPSSCSLSEVAHVLTPGLRFYAVTNDKTHMTELHDMIRRAVPDFQVPTVSLRLEKGTESL